MKTILVCVLSILTALGSCRESYAESKVNKKQRDSAVSTLDGFYKKFLSGSLSEARTNLLAAVNFIHDNAGLIPELQGALQIGYARLSLLERKAGNDALSRIYFEKSRYWRLIEREKIGKKPEEIIADHEKFTREDSDKFALEWDRTVTKGIGPRYLSETK